MKLAVVQWLNSEVRKAGRGRRRAVGLASCRVPYGRCRRKQPLARSRSIFLPVSSCQTNRQTGQRRREEGRGSHGSHPMQQVR